MGIFLVPAVRADIKQDGRVCNDTYLILFSDEKLRRAQRDKAVDIFSSKISGISLSTKSKPKAVGSRN
jgi:hypothetical protein